MRIVCCVSGHKGPEHPNRYQARREHIFNPISLRKAPTSREDVERHIQARAGKRPCMKIHGKCARTSGVTTSGVSIATAAAPPRASGVVLPSMTPRRTCFMLTSSKVASMEHPRCRPDAEDPMILTLAVARVVRKNVTMEVAQQRHSTAFSSVTSRTSHWTSRCSSQPAVASEFARA